MCTVDLVSEQIWERNISVMELMSLGAGSIYSTEKVENV